VRTNSPPPGSVASPISVNRAPHVPWFLREDGVAKVLGAVGVLVGVVFGAFTTYRATQPAPPPPPPPADIRCPPFVDSEAPRGSLCLKLYQLEGALGTLQAERDSRRAEDERQRKMLTQEQPKLMKPK
jgi:hypothetical protein